MIISAKHMITGDGKTVLEDQAVAIEDGKIKKIGTKEELIAEFPEKEIKDYAVNIYLDWIKMEKHPDEKCVIPSNILRQLMEKFNKQMGNHK